MAAFFLLKSLKGGGAYDLAPVIMEWYSQSMTITETEEIIMAKKRSIKVYGQSGYKLHDIIVAVANNGSGFSEIRHMVLREIL